MLANRKMLKVHTPKSARLIADGFLVAVLVIWWYAAKGLPAYVLPGPVDVMSDLLRFGYDHEMLWHLGSTGARVLGAVLISTFLGTAFAVLPLWWPWASEIVEHRIQPFVNAIPSIGWAIIGVIWFDVSNFAVMFVQVAILVPFCLVNVTVGIRQLDLEIIEMGRSFTRSNRIIFFKLVLPLLMPFIASSLRMALGMAWKLSLVSELFGASSGLGFVMLNAQESSNVALVIATCCIVVIAYVASDRLIMTPITEYFSGRSRKGRINPVNQ